MSEDFWDIICAALPMLGVLFALNVVLLATLVLTVPFLERGSASYYVSIMSFLVIGTSLVGIVAVIRTCRSR